MERKTKQEVETKIRIKKNLVGLAAKDFITKTLLKFQKNSFPRAQALLFNFCFPSFLLPPYLPAENKIFSSIPPD